MCHRGHFALDPQCSAANVGAFQLEVSVDQDLSVIVAEAIDDGVVKRKARPNCFHARVTQQRSTGSETRLSCTHVHEKTHPCKQGFEKKGATQTDAENLENSGDNSDRATMRSTTHTPQLCLHADQN